VPLRGRIIHTLESFSALWKKLQKLAVDKSGSGLSTTSAMPATALSSETQYCSRTQKTYKAIRPFRWAAPLYTPPWGGCAPLHPPALHPQQLCCMQLLRERSICLPPSLQSRLQQSTCCSSGRAAYASSRRIFTASARSGFRCCSRCLCCRLAQLAGALFSCRKCRTGPCSRATSAKTHTAICNNYCMLALVALQPRVKEHTWGSKRWKRLVVRYVPSPISESHAQACEHKSRRRFQQQDSEYIFARGQ
jgi:hypothetical protein